MFILLYGVIMISNCQDNLLKKEEYQRMAEKENFHWWFVGKRAILNSVLKRYLNGVDNLILDVGCGSGGNILFLKDFGSVVGIDPAKEALDFCRERGFKELVLGRAESISYPDNHFDLVTAFDVLEHLEQDITALEEMKRVSRGLVMVSVPAMPFLWNAQDEYLGHRRRYRKKDLIKKLEQVGLKVLESSYFVIPSVPAIIIRRFFEKIFLPNQRPHNFDFILPGPINSIFTAWLKLESLFLRSVPIMFGSSLYIITTKK